MSRFHAHVSCDQSYLNKRYSLISFLKELARAKMPGSGRYQDSCCGEAAGSRSGGPHGLLAEAVFLIVRSSMRFLPSVDNSLIGIFPCYPSSGRPRTIGDNKSGFGCDLHE